MDPVLRLNGEWVGEGAAASSTTWQLHVRGGRATLAKFSAGLPQPATLFDCQLAATPFTFALGEQCDEFLGFALDEYHLVLRGLDEGNDVIFSRPGLAELIAHDVYKHIAPAAEGRFSLSRWVIT